MKSKLMPKTKLGKWSVAFTFFFIFFLVIFFFIVNLGQRGGETFFSNLLLAIPITLSGIFGVFSFFTGIISIIRDKEREFLVYASTLLGLLVLVFVLLEVLFPH